MLLQNHHFWAGNPSFFHPVYVSKRKTYSMVRSINIMDINKVVIILAVYTVYIRVKIKSFNLTLIWGHLHPTRLEKQKDQIRLETKTPFKKKKKNLFNTVAFSWKLRIVADINLKNSNSGELLAYIQGCWSLTWSGCASPFQPTGGWSYEDSAYCNAL